MGAEIGIIKVLLVSATNEILFRGTFLNFLRILLEKWIKISRFVLYFPVHAIAILISVSEASLDIPKCLRIF